jgi:hypothetical protein
MNKIILIFATLLFSTGAFAANLGCNNGSLKGTFSYEVSGVNEFPFPNQLSKTFVTRSTSVVGLVYFDGLGQHGLDGHVKFIGVGSAAGVQRAKTATGTYVVRSDCSVVGQLVWQPGAFTSIFFMTLNQVDVERSPYLAYQANVLATDSDPRVQASGSGSITRLAGRFH